MNHSEIIQKVVEKTGISADICEKVVKMVEDQSGSAILDKIGGKDIDVKAVAGQIAGKLNLAPDLCEKVVGAFSDVVGSGIADKLGGLLGKK